MSKQLTEADKFLVYHSNPTELEINQLSEINALINKYPYCQSLHFLAAKASLQSPDQEKNLANAAAFAPSRKTLYQFIQETSSFETAVLEQETYQTKENQGFGQAFGVDLNQMAITDQSSQEEKSEEFIIDDEIQVVADEETLAKAENIPAENVEEEPVSEIERVEEVINETEEEKVQAFGDEETLEEEVQETTSAEAENIALENVEEQPVSEIEPIQEIAHQTEDEKNQAVADEETLEEEVQETTSLEEENIPAENLEEEPVSEIEPVEEVAQQTEEEKNHAVADEEEVEEESAEANNILSENLEEEPVSEIEPVEEVAQQTEEEKNHAVADLETLEEEVQETTSLEEENIPAENAEEEPVSEIEPVEEVAQETEEEKIQAVADLEILEEEVQETTSLEEEDTASENLELEPFSEIETIEEVAQETKEEKIQGVAVEESTLRTKSSEEFVFDNPVQSDFFAFAKREKIEPAPIEEQDETEKEVHLSAYDDDTLPYTFLWWLNKTRKEHALNTQPYVKAKVSKTGEIKKEPDHLQHQIAENIFHLRGVDEIGDSKNNFTVPYDFRKKETNIIEKFIKEEPQIKPPAANKIDTENKAKKSSEDSNEVVSETLAKIYVEQMLYHKALDVYKKLSLKFPEKSTYFASQIKYLELKVN